MYQISHGTWIRPRDETRQELASEIEEDHDKDDRTTTENNIALGYTCSAFKLIAILVLAQFTVKLGKTFTGFGLDPVHTVKVVVATGCRHGCLLLRKREKGEREARMDGLK